MTIRDFTSYIWYGTKIRIVTDVSHYFEDVEDKTLFAGENYQLLSEVNKKFLDYLVQSVGVNDDEIVIVVKN